MLSTNQARFIILPPKGILLVSASPPPLTKPIYHYHNMTHLLNLLNKELCRTCFSEYFKFHCAKCNHITLAAFSMINTYILELKTSDGPITILDTCRISKNVNISIENSPGINKLSSLLITVIILYKTMSYQPRSNWDVKIRTLVAIGI